jgi:hypothetical protein
MRALFLVLPLMLMPCVGCHRNEAARPPVKQAVDFSHLPGLRATTDLALRDELARIEEEKATPELLMRTGVPPQENIATGLNALFPPAQAPAIFAQSTELLPSGAFTFTPPALEKAAAFEKRYDRQRREARKVLHSPLCNFGIRYTDGFDADLSLVDVVRLCARLEAFEAAQCLSNAKVDGAVESVRQMLRLACCLASVKHVAVRVQGAYTRTEALAVLQAVVEHPRLNRTHLEQLSATFRDLLATWPSDADAWRGERALGLHGYELVRAGQADTLLTQEEAKQLDEQGILAELPNIAKQTVDNDERFYLQAMRRAIESCSRPYYARLEMFADLRNALQARSHSRSYPIIAGRLLLTNIQEGQGVQAQDRANCEAWALALAAATGQPAPPYDKNPLTGQAYYTLWGKGWVKVGNLAAARADREVNVAVPDLRLQ